MSILEKLKTPIIKHYDLEILGGTYTVRLLTLQQIEEFQASQTKAIKAVDTKRINDLGAELVLNSIVEGDGVALDVMSPDDLYEKVPPLLVKKAVDEIMQLNYGSKDGVEAAKKS